MKKENIRTITYKIPFAFDGKYLADFLAVQGYSSELIKHLKKTENVDMFHILHKDEEITINIIEQEKSEIEPNPDLKFDILYEDEDMLVVNKPADMPIHPSQGNYNNTLGNAIMAHTDTENFVYRPITRLDRDTSGVCLIAKNMLSASIFSRNIQNNLIKRTYLGICKGNAYNILYINPKLKEFKSLQHMASISMTIDIPIKREEESTIKRCIAPDGERAITKAYTLSYLEDYNVTLCKFILLTGRTHQIRVHMAHLGYPIIGDFLYNPDYSLIDRQALHSNELIMTHPITHELMRFVSPIPDDMNKILR